MDNVDTYVYVYAKMINGNVYVATRDMKFCKFDPDHVIVAWGSNTIDGVRREVQFHIKNAYTEDEGWSFAIEYEVII